MTANATRLLENALALPERDRAELAARLIESLDSGGEEDAAAAWEDEIARRVTELDNGLVQTVPWSEARRLILDTTHDAPNP